MLLQPNPSDKHTTLPDTPIAEAFRARAVAAIKSYLGARGATSSERANFLQTPERAAAGWAEVYDVLLTDDTLSQEQIEEILESIEEYSFNIPLLSKALIMDRVEEVLSTAFPMEETSDPGIVTQGPILVRSLCPHHLLPVEYEAFVAYQPEPSKDSMLGLSKLARVAQLLAARPVLQEQFAADIADALHYTSFSPRSELPQIESRGAAAHVIGRHHCMSCRGAMSDALTLTTALRGTFQSPNIKSEFYQAIRSINASSLHVEEGANYSEEDDEE